MSSGREPRRGDSAPRNRRPMLLGAVALAALAGLGGSSVLARHHSPVRRATAEVVSCVAAKLNGSALLPGTTLTASPLPGSRIASPHTQISLLGAPAQAISDVRARGSLSGEHDGRLMPYSQGDGASFVPAEPFAAGESVTVTGEQHIAQRTASFAFSFTVAEPDVLAHPPSSAKPAAKPGEVQTFHSQPGMVVPTVTVTRPSAQTASGYMFAAPYSGPGQDGPMIFDNAGNLVWFRPLPLGTEATNLQVQVYRHRPLLTWWQGYIPPQGFGEGEDVVVDSSYRTLFRVHAGNGYSADLHDFHLGENGTALLTIFDPVRCNLSAVGGTAKGATTDTAFQEVDLKSGLVRREWHALDHVAMSDSYASARSANLAWPLDYFHINTVQRRRDGSLLISARNTSALYVLDPASGRITLQIGGKHSDLAGESTTATAFQHDAEELDNGEISVFDNGGVPMVHSQSRGIVLAVDANARTARLVGQYEHPVALKAASQGNMQHLQNGDYFIGWGAEPYFSEFSPSGEMIFDARMPPATESYRGYRFAWSATPAQPPSIAAARSGQRTDVYASWNGATEVASWRLLGGPGPGLLTPLAVHRRTGFETTISLSRAPSYLAVQALGSSSEVLASSRAIRG